MLTTPDLDVDQAIQVQLEAFMLKHEIDKTAVVASVPGNMAFARFAKLPPVEPKKIPDIVKFEAQQQIPFPIEQVEWDYQVFQQDDSPDVEVGIFAITKERVMQYLANYRIVDMKVDQLTLSPLAVYNTFNYESPDGEGAIYMDIGTVSTDVIIVEDGGIWLRTLPIGGNNFTEALVKQFKISFPKAEKLKREAATSKYAKQIFQAMRAVFADLVQEVQRSLGFYQSLNRDSNLTKLVGVGSTFRLPGLQKFLKQQLQIDVVRPDSFARLPVVDGKRESEFSNHALNMATACGLAIQGLGLEKVSANILPRHVLASRMWRAKQPWIAASAAC
ncbi:MAG: pilus assembly protein PilM, partial [Planctomycetota bacterium]